VSYSYMLIVHHGHQNRSVVSDGIKYADANGPMFYC